MNYVTGEAFVAFFEDNNRRFVREEDARGMVDLSLLYLMLHLELLSFEKAYDWFQSLREAIPKKPETALRRGALEQILDALEKSIETQKKGNERPTSQPMFEVISGGLDDAAEPPHPEPEEPE